MTYNFRWTDDEFECERYQDEDGWYASPEGTIRFQCVEYPGMYWYVSPDCEIEDYNCTEEYPNLTFEMDNAIHEAASMWLTDNCAHVDGACEYARDCYWAKD